MPPVIAENYDRPADTDDSFEILDILDISEF
jgi:hypothetical protein